MISFEAHGSFKNTEKFLGVIRNPQRIFAQLESIAQDGVAALSRATPSSTGLAANSWHYEINQSRSGCTIYWSNTNIENGFPVAVMIQYGHGTGTGGYVRGIDYINPAMAPIFDKLAERAWKVVTSA